MKKLTDSFAAISGVLLIIALLLALFYFDFTAYQQRFPQAEPWTYVFQHR